MTREQALDRLRSLGADWDIGNVALVDSLIELGLLKVETTEALVLTAAVQLLQNMIIPCRPTQHGNTAAKLTRDGAMEVLDILTKSGFRITRDEK